jgi:hypothetical protein
MPRIKDIVPCERGYHVFERKDILPWVNTTLYEAEIRGETIGHEDKTVAQSARLIRPIPGCNERTLRLFACRVAEDVLPIYEREYPDDDRPRKAIETARRYANGEATDSELAAARAAARAAAWAVRAAAGAVRDAAWAAAGAAADAAWAAANAAWAADAAAAREKYTDWLWEMLEGER